MQARSGHYYDRQARVADRVILRADGREMNLLGNVSKQMISEIGQGPEMLMRIPAAHGLSGAFLARHFQLYEFAEVDGKLEAEKTRRNLL